VIAVILDHRLPFLADESGSLLMVPLGTCTLADHIISRIVRAVEGEIFVVPTFAETEGYAQRLAEHTAFDVRVLEEDEFATFVSRRGPQERLLFLDSARGLFSSSDLDVFLDAPRGFHGLRCLVAVGSDSRRTRERVEADATGNVRRVERIYDGVCWPETASAVALAEASAGVVRGIRFGSLGELRSILTARGAICRDEPVARDGMNLMCEAELLAAHERESVRAGRWQANQGFTVMSAGVLLGQGAVVDSSARLVPPVLVYPRSIIERGATIVGPAVIGMDCTVKRGATVAQALLTSGTVLASGVTVRRSVVGGVVSASVSRDTGMGLSVLTNDARESYRVVGADGLSGVRRTRRDGGIRISAKRTLDVAVAALSLVLLSPLLLAAFLLVKTTSRGPALFAHSREGREGREFPCLKFRTMVVGADRLQAELASQNEVDGPQFKIERDPRVTSVGRFLRATNLDELPQLWNVFRGQMSLVGPRPSPFRENQICVPWRQARLSVPPGITGLWQVCRGNREQSDFNQWIYYDILYVRNLSILLDLKILAATVLTLGGKWRVPQHWLLPGTHLDAVEACASPA